MLNFDLVYQAGLRIASRARHEVGYPNFRWMWRDIGFVLGRLYCIGHGPVLDFTIEQLNLRPALQ